MLLLHRYNNNLILCYADDMQLYVQPGNNDTSASLVSETLEDKFLGNQSNDHKRCVLNCVPVLFWWRSSSSQFAALSTSSWVPTLKTIEKETDGPVGRDQTHQQLQQEEPDSVQTQRETRKIRSDPSERLTAGGGWRSVWCPSWSLIFLFPTNADFT